MSEWLPSLIGVIGEGINTGINYGLSGSAAERDRNANYELNEQAAKNAYERQVAMQERYYTPTALLRQYNEAGLSPSLLFGGTPGQGGTSVPQGHGTAGPTTPYVPMDILKSAQAASLFADAKLKEAQANTEKETGVQKGLAMIAAQYAEAGYKEASKKLVEAETDYQEIENYVASATKEINIERVNKSLEYSTNLAEQAFWAAKNEQKNYEFNEAAFEKRLEQVDATTKEIQARTQNILKDTILKGEQIKLTQEERNKVIAEYKKWRAEVWIEFMKTCTQQALVNSQIDFNTWLKSYQGTQLDQFWAKLAQDKVLTEKQIKIAREQLDETIRHNMKSENIQLINAVSPFKTPW